MGGAWVFPGGAVDPAEGSGPQALRAAAVRELREEAGIVLDGPSALVPYARWITPEAVKIRFDTWFFLAPAPPHAQPTIDGSEIVDVDWFAPDAALRAGRDGRLLLVLPTVRQLEELAAFPSAAALLEHARTTAIVPVRPRIEFSGETARIVLPGDDDVTRE